MIISLTVDGSDEGRSGALNGNVALLGDGNENRCACLYDFADGVILRWNVAFDESSPWFQLPLFLSLSLVPLSDDSIALVHGYDGTDSNDFGAFVLFCATF